MKPIILLIMPSVKFILELKIKMNQVTTKKPVLGIFADS